MSSFRILLVETPLGLDSPNTYVSSLISSILTSQKLGKQFWIVLNKLYLTTLWGDPYLKMSQSRHLGLNTVIYFAYTYEAISGVMVRTLDCHVGGPGSNPAKVISCLYFY